MLGLKQSLGWKLDLLVLWSLELGLEQGLKLRLKPQS